MAALPHLTPNTTIVRSSKQASANLGGETAVLSLQDGVYYSLDAVGAHIWELIEEPRTVRDVRDMLCNQYDLDAERCEGDLIALLRQLAAHVS